MNSSPLVFVWPTQLGSIRLQENALPISSPSLLYKLLTDNLCVKNVTHCLAGPAIISLQEVIKKCHTVGHVPAPRALTSPFPFTSKNTDENEIIPEAARFVRKDGLPGDWPR